MPTMVRYACSICGKRCITKCIECSGCKSWVHASCVPMDEKELKSWDETNHQFFCRRCMFSDDADFSARFYDAGAALKR